MSKNIPFILSLFIILYVSVIQEATAEGASYGTYVPIIITSGPTFYSQHTSEGSSRDDNDDYWSYESMGTNGLDDNTLDCKYIIRDGKKILECTAECAALIKIRSKKAVKTCKELCASNNPSACNELGVLFQQGKGVDQSYSEAFDYFAKACDMNYSIGCMNAGGNPYYHSKVYYEKACTLDDGNGCSNIAFDYLQNKRYELAKMFFEKACSLNNARGCTWLGKLYFSGIGVEKSSSKAVTYYKKSCSLHDDDACRRLEKLFKNNKEVKPNKK